ncbi:MAG: tRNA pseudouridine(55) synthase TruB [Solobacterium sp.]|nr:tRNA pseudouridine(55) synthase TruB [Solobacterium sp.]MDD5982273.1 tRNA pseudouridine(55) synthase TruB [Solobacterium sp.]
MSILYIDKPKGMTSFDICFRLRKVLGTRKIGHTGTLDPNATGLMIVLSDKDTKANQFLVSDSKEYIAECLIGCSTDTLDIDGSIIEEKEETMPDRNDIDNVLKSFLGDSMQLPPMTSAIKVDGKKLYEYQREGKTVELEPRPVNVSEIELLNVNERTFSFRCKVSSGTYIRVLLQDILKKLNIIGTLKELRRTSINEINVDQADKFEDVLQGIYHVHDLHELLIKRYPEIEVENTFDFINGKRVKLDCNYDEVLISHEGKCVAIYAKENNYYVSKRGLF